MKKPSVFWRILFWLVGQAEPWPSDVRINVSTPAVRTMIARARLDRMRAAGTMVCWTYSRDRLVERRELRLETRAQKFERWATAKNDRVRLPTAEVLYERERFRRVV